MSISLNNNRSIFKTNWNFLLLFRGFDSISYWTWDLFSFSNKYFIYLNFYINRLLLPFSSITSIFGFVLLLAIMIQLLSGFFLAWYYIPEPGLVIELREEMFEETRFGAEVFAMHVRGVDVIFVFSYFHILKKIHLKNFITTDGDGWILGGYAFVWFHFVVGLGICLSASHLSDLTLTIGANIFWSLVNNIHKTYYFIFTNKHLNIDTLVRLMLLHYFTPWYYLYLVKLHIMFCHEGWDSDSDINTYEDKTNSWISWFCILVITPTHFEGLMWMGLFFILLIFMPIFYNFYNSFHKLNIILPMQNSYIQIFFFSLFLFSLFVTASILPCGRYYYDPEGGYVGNTWLKWSYQYLYWYLGWIIFHLDILDFYFYSLIYHFYKKLL